MVTKNMTSEKKGKVKVGKLKVNKETVKDLSTNKQKEIKGGLRVLTNHSDPRTCASVGNASC